MAVYLSIAVLLLVVSVSRVSCRRKVVNSDLSDTVLEADMLAQSRSLAKQPNLYPSRQQQQLQQQHIQQLQSRRFANPLTRSFAISRSTRSAGSQSRNLAVSQSFSNSLRSAGSQSRTGELSQSRTSVSQSRKVVAHSCSGSPTTSHTQCNMRAWRKLAGRRKRCEFCPGASLDNRSRMPNKCVSNKQKRCAYDPFRDPKLNSGSCKTEIKVFKQPSLICSTTPGATAVFIQGHGSVLWGKRGRTTYNADGNGRRPITTQVPAGKRLTFYVEEGESALKGKNSAVIKTIEWTTLHPHETPRASVVTISPNGMATPGRVRHMKLLKLFRYTQAQDSAGTDAARFAAMKTSVDAMRTASAARRKVEQSRSLKPLLFKVGDIVSFDVDGGIWSKGQVTKCHPKKGAYTVLDLDWLENPKNAQQERVTEYVNSMQVKAYNGALIEIESFTTLNGSVAQEEIFLKQEVIDAGAWVLNYGLAGEQQEGVDHPDPVMWAGAAAHCKKHPDYYSAVVDYCTIYKVDPPSSIEDILTWARTQAYTHIGQGNCRDHKFTNQWGFPVGMYGYAYHPTLLPNYVTGQNGDKLRAFICSSIADRRKAPAYCRR